MMIFKKKKVDYNLFVDDKNKDITKFNLPKHFEFCKKCLTTNQRPTTRSEHSIKEDVTKATRFFDGVCEATLSTPTSKNSLACFKLLIPPPIVTGIKIFFNIVATKFFIQSIPYKEPVIFKIRISSKSF